MASKVGLILETNLARFRFEPSSSNIFSILSVTVKKISCSLIGGRDGGIEKDGLKVVTQKSGVVNSTEGLTCGKSCTHVRKGNMCQSLRLSWIRT